jgi:hypothetical protein
VKKSFHEDVFQLESHWASIKVSDQRRVGPMTAPPSPHAAKTKTKAVPLIAFQLCPKLPSVDLIQISVFHLLSPDILSPPGSDMRQRQI